MSTYENLRRIPLFTGLNDQALQALADRARMSEYGAEERIVSQSDDVQAFFIVLSGRVKISRSSPRGKEQILYLVEEGQPFCFCTAFTDRPYPVDVTALEPSLVAMIPARDMEDLARNAPGLMLKIVQILSGRLLEAMNLVEALALQGTQERIAGFLLHAESCFADEPGTAFSLPISHREMAKIVGTTSETLSRVIQKLKRRNLIEASGRVIRVVDHAELSDADYGE
ncbi:MAG: Crp/Fnr family transcriptional regulator [Pseudodesulfovibrio sp.]|jgi:CRP/FNR family transcriptional regulator|uniref:CRP/FNR family transcriptional regulator n=1 Tax=Pseudodesulfovibrio indicus TaxID=1716143 RepID=A0A126QRG1_9BACT|nr:Crp/Fnr family transcriptional regulator [Pseudodesulfovibrio indicus]AMK12554.1 cyclic nucleotide-binding protein [Pseudodesulfovibrio indicus]TDT90865.1 CRP/FNR family transcriptional regulator [Pseudodesulfovibrio indicus]